MENPIYDAIGAGYNVTRQADPYLVSRLLHHIAPVQNQQYLDIGCGTGNYTAALAQAGLALTGIEPSAQMLAQAKARSVNVAWLQGSAAKLPLDSDIYDGAIATLTIHHLPSLADAFRETNRVLKPGARVIIFTADPDQMRTYWLNHYFPRMMERAVAQMPVFTNIHTAATSCGFEITETEKYFINESLIDLFLYSGKHRPNLYLDERVRKGISSFVTLASPDEVQHGLRQLDKDIQTGNFARVANQFDITLGDYQFIVLRKI